MPSDLPLYQLFPDATKQRGKKARRRRTRIALKNLPFPIITTKPTSTSMLQKIVHIKWLLLILASFYLMPLQASMATPSQGCKLVRKFADATGEVDMRSTFAEGQLEEMLRQNPSIMCVAWRIVGYDREAIRIQFREFNVSNRQSALSPVSTTNEQGNCWGNMLYIKDSDTAFAKKLPSVSTITGPYCGQLKEPVFWWSNGNDIVIEYHIRSLELAKRDRFKFQFSVLTPLHGCGYEAIVYSPSHPITNKTSGQIVSPFDRSQASHSRCYWSVVGPEGYGFNIEFTKYTIDPRAPFVLTINDIVNQQEIGEEESSTIIGPRCCESSSTTTPANLIKGLDSYEDLHCLCLSDKPPPVQSASNIIHIYYESRSMLTTVNQGFSLEFSLSKRNSLQSTSSTVTTTKETSTTETTRFSTTARTKSDYEYLYDDVGVVSTPRHVDNSAESLAPILSFEDETSAPKETTPLPLTTETTRNFTVGIPIIYIDDDDVVESPRPNRTTASKSREKGTSETEEDYYPTKVVDGPMSMFGAASRRKQSPNNSASHNVPFAPILLVLVLVLVVAFRGL